MSLSITNGQQSSATALNSILGSIQGQGSSILSLLSEVELTTMVDYDRRLTALAGRQQKAARVKAPGVYALFLVSDFNSINQGLSTATIRPDSAAASLRERMTPAEALVTSTSFSASSGTVVALSSDQTLLSVTSDSVPTGTFTMELQEAVDLSVLTINLVAMSSSPTVALSVSEDGLVYTPADNVALQGSTLNAWCGSSSVKFIQLVLTPSHPDNLQGNVYTFGITGFAASASVYNLVSDISFTGTSFSPQTAALKFVAEDTGGVIYNLSLVLPGAAPNFVPVVNGSTVAIPGVSNFTETVSGNSSGVFAVSIPANAYLRTLTIKNNTTGEYIRFVEGMSLTDPNVANLQKSYCSIIGGNLQLVPASFLTGTFTISCLVGPSSLQASLLVHMSTTDRTQTPVFKGASLEEQ